MDTSRLRKLAEELRRQKELEASMRMAKKRQFRMLPKIPEVAGYEFRVLYLPAASVSGDFYDFIQVSEYQIGVAIGDVAGHGPEAALIMGMAKKAMMIYARGRSSPAEVLAITNEDLAADLDGETFLSVAYGILDHAVGQLRFARAGHNPPLLINPQRDPMITPIKPDGMIVGVDAAGKRFREVIEEVEIELLPGDIFLQYTDGLVEAPNKRKEKYGEPRLQRILQRTYGQPLAEMLSILEEDLISWTADLPQEDDISIIALARLA